MRLLQEIAAVFRVTLKRLRTQPGITLASICGFTVAVILMETVPLYADAVNFRILQEQLATLDEKRRPPLTTFATRLMWITFSMSSVSRSCRFCKVHYLLNNCFLTSDFSLPIRCRRAASEFETAFTGAPGDARPDREP